MSLRERQCNESNGALGRVQHDANHLSETSAAEAIRSLAISTALPGNAPECDHCLRLAFIERQIALLLGSTQIAPTRPIKLIAVERDGEILGLQKSAVHELSARGELRRVKLGNSSSRRAAARWIEDEVFAYAWALVAQNRSSLVSSVDADSDFKKVVPRKAVQKQAPLSSQTGLGKRAAG